MHGTTAKFAARRMIGKVPDSLGVLWHHRAVMMDAMGLDLNYILAHNDKLDEAKVREVPRSLATRPAEVGSAS